MTTLDFVGTAPLVRPGIALIKLHDELWRVTLPDGQVLGYIERFLERGIDRFRAKRLNAVQRRFLPMGEFWIMDDAIECFRFS
jgi:hypothetical protein